MKRLILIENFQLFSDVGSLRLFSRRTQNRTFLLRANARRGHLAAAERRLPPPKSFLIAGRRSATLRAPPQVHPEADQGRPVPFGDPVSQQPAEVLPQG